MDFLSEQVAGKEDMSPEKDKKVGELSYLSDKKEQGREVKSVEHDDDGKGKVEGKDMVNLLDPLAGSATRFTQPNGDGATNQLTIFYSGSVSVYDAVTPEKAHAIMLIAAAASAANAKNSKTVTAKPVFTRALSLQSISTATPAQNQALLSSNNALTKLQEELPIARRHSLQRFLEKRRDRIVTKAPYTMTKPAADPTMTESSTKIGIFVGSPIDQKAMPSPVAANID